MITVNYGDQFRHRISILESIKATKEKNPNYKVIDVGGSAFSWTHDIADVIVDFHSTREQDFKFNISNDWEWRELLDYVEKHGKFDYAICTHTLEDVSHPATVIRNLEKIAKEGVISMPTIDVELSKIEDQKWLGWIHHKYLFDFIDGEIVFAPKLIFIAGALEKGLEYPYAYQEIIFHWSDTIPYRPFMNDYLGPNAQAVIDEYGRFIMSAVKKSRNSEIKVDSQQDNK